MMKKKNKEEEEARMKEIRTHHGAESNENEMTVTAADVERRIITEYERQKDTVPIEDITTIKL